VGNTFNPPHSGSGVELNKLDLLKLNSQLSTRPTPGTVLKRLDELGNRICWRLSTRPTPGAVLNIFWGKELVISYTFNPPHSGSGVEITSRLVSPDSNLSTRPTPGAVLNRKQSRA